MTRLEGKTIALTSLAPCFFAPERLPGGGPSAWQNHSDRRIGKTIEGKTIEGKTMGVGSFPA